MSRYAHAHAHAPQHTHHRTRTNRPSPKAHFKVIDHTLSGLNIDPKSVVVSPSTKVQVVVMRETVGNQYFVWNSLGSFRCCRLGFHTFTSPSLSHTHHCAHTTWTHRPGTIRRERVRRKSGVLIIATAGRAPCASSNGQSSRLRHKGK
jgi:ABC-type nickel/cobalt efflux system permease component RcnA